MTRLAHPLRVAMVSRRVHPAHGPGGLERHVFDLVTGLATLGVQVHLFSESPRDAGRRQIADDMLRSAVTPHWVSGRWFPVGDRTGTVVLDRVTNYFVWATVAARRVLSATDAPWSVIHAHGLAGWALARARRRRRFSEPLVSTMQGLEEFRSHLRLKRWAYLPFRRGIRTVARGSSAVVTTDHSLQPLVEHHLRVPASSQVVIPNVVHPERCRALGDVTRGHALLTNLGLDRPSPILLSVGRLEVNKGFPVLVDALRRVSPDLPSSWAWVLVGDGPERAAITAMVRDAGLGSHCRFMGRVSDRDLHSLYSVASWFVHPTLYEGSSLVTLEAMAHGLPVVATRTGGLPDKVVDGSSGFLVAPGDAVDLGRRLVDAVGVDGRAYGAVGQRLCERTFSWRASAERHVELYERLLSTPPLLDQHPVDHDP